MISFSFFHEAAKNTPAAQALRRKAESQKDLRRKKIAKTAVAGNQALQGVTAKDESKPKSKIAQAQASKSVKSFSQAQRDARRQDLQGRADQIKGGRSTRKKALGTAGKLAKGIGTTGVRKVGSTGQGFGKADARQGGSGSGMRGTMNALGATAKSIRSTLGREPGQTRSAVGKWIGNKVTNSRIGKEVGTAVKKGVSQRLGKPGLATGVNSPKRDVQGLDAKQRLQRMQKFKRDKKAPVRKWGGAVTEEFSCWREEFIWETDKKYPDKVKEIKPMTGKNTIIINPNDEADKYSGR